MTGMPAPPELLPPLPLLRLLLLLAFVLQPATCSSASSRRRLTTAATVRQGHGHTEAPASHQGALLRAGTAWSIHERALLAAGSSPHPSGSGTPTAASAAAAAPATTAAAANAATTTCAITLTPTTASVTCSGPPGLISLAPTKAPLKVAASSNVKPADAACAAQVPPTAAALSSWASAGLTQAAGAAASAVLRVCSSAPHLILADSVVSDVPIPHTRRSNSSTMYASKPALSVVALTGSVTLRNCSARGVLGGAAVHLTVGGREVRVEGCEFTRNMAAAKMLGGGLVVVAGPVTRLVTIGNSSFVGNAAGGGAGAWVDMRGVAPGGRFLLTGSNLFENGTSLDAAGSGLTINATGTQGVLVDVLGSGLFAGNHGTSPLMVNVRRTHRVSITVTGQHVFRNNKVPDWYGGGMRISGYNSTAAVITLSGNVTFSSNTAYAGGGLSVELDGARSGAVAITGSVRFLDNNATGWQGGGVYVSAAQGSSNVTVTVRGNTSFIGNSALCGGGLETDFESSAGGTVVIGGSVTFQGNGAGSSLITPGGLGGGAHMNFTMSRKATLAVAGSALFIDNTAQIAGGGLMADFNLTSSSRISIGGSSRLAGNVALIAGGGAYLALNSAVLGNATVHEDALITSNAATHGGGLYVNGVKANSSTGVVKGRARFVSNAAVGGGGGGAMLFFTEARKSTISMAGSVLFQTNSAGMFGGGAHAALDNSVDCVASVGQDATFKNNSAQQGGGWAVTLINQTIRGVANISGNARFIRNSAGVQGGGALIGWERSQSSRLAVMGSASFEGNQASDSGGGLLAIGTQARDSQFQMGGSVAFVSNQALTAAGGAAALLVVQAQGGTATVDGGASRFDCRGPQFVNNSAHTEGGAIFMVLWGARDYHAKVKSVAMIGNAAGGGAGALIVHANTSSASSFTLSDSCFADNHAAQGYAGGVSVFAGPRTGNVFSWVQVSIANTAFINNSIGSGNGGGLVVDGSSEAFLPMHCASADRQQCNYTFAIMNVTFAGNTATLGGGLWAIDTQCQITSSRFVQNSAGQSGGGAAAKGVAALVLQDVVFDSNRAQDQGGGLLTVLGDDLAVNNMICRNCTIRNNTAQVGGGAQHTGGNITYLQSTIAANSAGQRGGGCAYFDVCTQSQSATATTSAATITYTCRLRLGQGVAVFGNEAPVGGGVFLGTPDTKAYDPEEVQRATTGHGGNSATYSKDVAVAPGRESLAVASVTGGAVPSSTGAAGATGLVVETDQRDTQLQVDFCNIKQRGGAYLTGAEASTIEGIASTGSVRRYAARFQDLRLMQGAAGQHYCLRVFAPDFPLVTPRRFTLTIRGCVPGEQNDLVSGCTPCPANQYGFQVNASCANCHPNAQCQGGARFVPLPGYWHSAWNSSAIYHCPNRAACRGDASVAAVACQGNRTACSNVGAADTCRLSHSSGAGCYQYSDLLCAKGYTSKLCSSCAPGYGSGAAFRCRGCLSAAATAVFLLLGGAVACLIVATIAVRAVGQQQRQLVGKAELATTSTCLTAASGSTHSLLEALPEAQDAFDQDTHAERDQSTGCTTATSSHTTTNKSQAIVPQPTATKCATHGQASIVADQNLLQRLLRDVEVADVFKVLVVYAQYIGILRNLVIDWPRGLLALMAAARVVVAPGSSDWVSLDCLGRVSSGAVLWLRMLVALMVVLLSSLLACALMAWGPKVASWVQHTLLPRLRCAKPERLARVNRQTKAVPLSDVAVAAAVAGLFSVYASLVTTSMSAFGCLSVDGGAYWVRDPDVRCWTRQHAVRALLPGLLGLVVLCLGVPVLVLWLSHRRDRLAAEAAEKVPRFDRRYGFLYRLYRPGCRYWEALLCLQTVALVAVDQFARQAGALYQLVAVAVVLFVFMAMWNAWRPFRSRTLTHLYLAGMGCLQLTCLLMMALLRGYRLGSANAERGVVSEGVRVLVGVVMVLLNCLFIVACLVAMVYAGLAQVAAPVSQLRHIVKRSWAAARGLASSRSSISCTHVGSGQADK